MNDISATYDEEVQLPLCAFTREGYTFTGWGSYKGEDKVKNSAGKDGAVVTLKASWRGLPVNVIANLNYSDAENIVRTGAVGNNYNYIVKPDGGTQYSELESPVRPGYTCDGWFDAAEGGNEITNQYKFTAEDAEKDVTLYAHWTKGITVHFDGNGYERTIADETVKPDEVFSKLPSLSSHSYPANKKLDGWYIKNNDGSFGDAVTKDIDFSSLDEVTLIAKWRDYQYIIKFNIKYADKSSVNGTMADQPAPFGKDVKLSKCAFTREGYDFAGWAISSYDPVEYQDEATIKREWDDDWYDGSEDNETFNLYAVWTENISKAAIDAMNEVIPSDNIIRAETTLPTSGEGYTISYSSSNTELLSDSGAVTLPESGSAKVTLTATITDTVTSKTYTKEYILTLYSATTATTEAELNAAVSKLTGTSNRFTARIPTPSPQWKRSCWTRAVRASRFPSRKL